jgi:hypothetical protein
MLSLQVIGLYFYKKLNFVYFHLMETNYFFLITSIVFICIILFLLVLKIFYPKSKVNYILIFACVVIVVGNIVYTQFIDLPHAKSLKEYEGKLHEISSSKVKYISLYSIPNQDIRYDSIIIINKDSIDRIISFIKNAKEGSYAHSPVECEMILSIQSEGINRLDFKILNIGNRVVIFLLSNTIEQEKLITFESDGINEYLSSLCDKIHLYSRK